MGYEGMGDWRASEVSRSVSCITGLEGAGCYSSLPGVE